MNLYKYIIILLVISGCQNNLKRGKHYAEHDDYNKSLEYFNKELQDNPENQEAYALRGYSQICLGNFENAICDLKKAVALDENDIYSITNLADLYFKRNEYDLAKSLFLKAAKIDNNHRLVNYNLGVVYFNEQKYDSALFFFNSELQISPRDVETLIFKGQTLQWLDRPREGITVINEALTYAKEPNGYYLLGTIYFDLKKYDSAVILHTRAIQLDSTNIDYFVTRSAAFIMTGKYENALKDCNKALGMDSQYIDAYNC